MPSEKVLEQKKQDVKELAEKLKSSAMGIVISYKGIDVENDTKFRKEMREADLEYFVVKNSMLGFASKEVGYDFDEHLHGTTAIALSKEDPIAISKIIAKYAKELKDSTEFHVKTGFLNGSVIGVDLINEYGTMPTKEESVVNLLNLLVNPVRMFAMAVEAVAKKKESEGSGEE